MYEDLINSFKNSVSVQEKDETSNRFCTHCNEHGVLNGNVYECPSCGQVLNELFINTDVDWTDYNSTGDFTMSNSRATSIDTYMPQVSMSTSMIGASSISDYRLKKVHKWISMPYREKSLSKVFKLINHKINEANLNKNVLNTSKAYYNKISMLSSTRGMIRQGMIASCVYTACKSCNCPRSPSEIAILFDMKKSDFSRGLKRFGEIFRRLGINNDKEIQNLNSYFDRFINRLAIKQKLNEKDEKSLQQECFNHPMFNINGNYITNIALIILNCSLKLELNIEIDDVADVAQVSKFTISKHFKEVCQEFKCV